MERARTRIRVFVLGRHLRERGGKPCTREQSFDVKERARFIHSGRRGKEPVRVVAMYCVYADDETKKNEVEASRACLSACARARLRLGSRCSLRLKFCIPSSDLPLREPPERRTLTHAGGRT